MTDEKKEPQKLPLSRRSFVSYLCLAGILLSIGLTQLRNFKATEFTLKSGSNANSAPIDLPFKKFEHGKADHTFEGNVTFSALSMRRMRVIVDDCVTLFRINGEPVSLSNIPQRKLCDYKNGFVVDVENYVHPGTNRFELGVINHGGTYALSLMPFKADCIYLLALLSGLFCAALLMWRCMGAREMSIGLRCIILAAAFVIIAYLECTNFDQREHDVHDHLAYIKYLADNFGLPSPIDGGQFKHPPLYYMVAAVVWKISLASGLRPENSLQLLSLIFYTGFLCCAAAILRLVLADRQIASLSIMMLVFWPSGIIHSIRIGNDTCFYFLYSLSLLFLLRWWRSDSPRDLIKSSLIGGLAVLTKSNSLTLIAITSCLVLAKKSLLSSKLPWRDVCTVALIYCLSTTLNLADNFWYYLNDPKYNWLNSSVYTLNSRLSVNNSLSNYLYFDYTKFVTIPFTSPWLDHSGRQSFWYYMLKTSLFGEFSFYGRTQELLAIFLSGSLLVIWTSCFCGIFTARLFSERLLLLANFIFLLFALFYFRFTLPYSVHTDYRYIYPLTISVVAYSNLFISELVRSRLYLLGYALILNSIVFSLASAAFFLVDAGQRAGLVP